MKFNARTKSSTAGFTLAEVLAALMFMAVVVPVAIGALRVASLSGEVAQRKSVAVRVADRVLNEAVVMQTSTPMAPSGVATENGIPFRWTLRNDSWPVSVTSTSSMQVMTVTVNYTAQGRDFDVRLSTLVNSQ